MIGTKRTNDESDGIALAVGRRGFCQGVAAVLAAIGAGLVTVRARRARAAVGPAPATRPAPKPGGDMKTQDELKPGDTVPTTGTYDVTHDRLDGDEHALPHQVAAVAGETFPRCRVCGTEARFRLRPPAEHVKSHELFKE